MATEFQRWVNKPRLFRGFIKQPLIYLFEGLFMILLPILSFFEVRLAVFDPAKAASRFIARR